MSPRHSSELSLEYVLLALLDQKPMHGYELYQNLCEMEGISRIWNIKQALLYAILDKLEDRGFLSSQFVQGEAHPPRKYFHLTELGKSALLNWMKSPVRRARDIRQEFLAKLIVARRYGKSDVLELIHAQQQACQDWFNELETDGQTINREHVDEWIVHSFRLNRVTGLMDWLKELEIKINLVLDEDSSRI
jgi:DNA-binding PadR family transcriptional regulator